MLARDVAHTTDVDGMLAHMTPQQFDEWALAYQIWHGQQQADKPDSLTTFRSMAGV